MEMGTFDVEAGMTVFAVDGEKIGAVREVAGFGSDRVSEVSKQTNSEPVTQARTGTGYFKVDRTGVLGTGAGDLVVPFHGIKEVTSTHDVILNDTVVSELRRRGTLQEAHFGQAKPASQRRKWHLR